jgi:hypothetical protein
MAVLLKRPRPGLRQLAIREYGFDPAEDDPDGVAVSARKLAGFAEALPDLEEFELELGGFAKGLSQRPARPRTPELAAAGGHLRCGARPRRARTAVATRCAARSRVEVLRQPDIYPPVLELAGAVPTLRRIRPYDR